jgi:hypothetical protein
MDRASNFSYDDDINDAAYEEDIETEENANYSTKSLKSTETQSY